MTVLTTIASLSKNGFGYATNTLNLGLGQYVTTFTVGGGSSVTSNRNKITPDSTGNAYILTSNTMGISKLDTTGNVVFQTTVANTFIGGSGTQYYMDQMDIDSTGNIYTVGYTPTGPTQSAILIKYDNTGNILWQRNVTPGANSFQYSTSSIQIDNGDSPLIIINNSRGYNVPTPFTSALIRYSSTGTLVNQRQILTANTSPMYIGYDSTANTILAVGNDWTNGVNFPTLYNCAYAANNTTTGNTIRKIDTDLGFSRGGTIVADSTYYYQIGELRVTGDGSAYRSVLMRITKSTGAISYCRQIFDSLGVGQLFELRGLTIDNSGYLYVIGGNGNFAYIGKFEASTGNFVWLKSFQSTNNTSGIPGRNPITWSNGYIYFCTTSYNSTAASTYYSYWKLKDTGVLPNGNWQNYTVTAITCTFNTVNTTIGSLTDSPANTTYANATPTYTTATSTFTTLRSAIP
jgi:hypothetical protein